MRRHTPLFVRSMIGLVIAAVLLATATPALRAARIDPVTVLRCD